MFFSELPDEIVEHLLFYVSPQDNLESFQLVSRHFNRLANGPLLWKHHCQTTFRFWHPEHDFPSLLKQRASTTPWKNLFLLRKRRNEKASRLLNDIIATKVGRLQRAETVARLGYDVKDYLLEQSHAPDSLDDVLARRHYSHSILNSIHRSVAIEEWHKMSLASSSVSATTSATTLERALGAFDLFVLRDQPGDLDDISALLDKIAADFKESFPEIQGMPTRQKALTLNRWLRVKNLTGLQNPEKNYRNLRNCLIGQALRHEDHDSIPIISSAIFCCVAERLGLQAQCCAFPTHVHAIVTADDGHTLDGAPLAEADQPLERMYLDPYGSDNEIASSDLQSLLSRIGWQSNTEAFLDPVPPSSVATRTARNIRATAARVLEARGGEDLEVTQLITGKDPANMDTALYAALWASLLLTPVDAFEWDETLEPFLREFARSWNNDAWLVKKYLCPRYSQFLPFREGFLWNGPNGWNDPNEILNLVNELDGVQPPVFHRDPERVKPVTYKIGQIFRHRRYGWFGAINGWTDQELPNLVRPRNQTFYTCLRTTGGPDRHVVAEDNIVITTDLSDVAELTFPLAGKFFKRFDAETCTFVSNVKEQYPDD